MPTYIILGHYTEEGITKVKDSPTRLDAVKQLAQSVGGAIKEFYLTTGQYDFIAIAEGPDDDTMAKIILTVGSTGAVRTETLRAFTEDEYRKIIAGLP